MKNDAHCIAVAETKTADAMTQVDPIGSAYALHRPMMHGEDYAISLLQANHFGP
jgi:hypothetical protein